MPRAKWLLFAGQPVIEVELQEKYSGFTFTRTLLADTGGSASVAVDSMVAVAVADFKNTSVLAARFTARLKCAQLKSPFQL